MDLTFRFLCNIILYSIRLYFHHQTHPQLGFVSTLAEALHSFWSHFCSSSIAYWAPTNLGSSSFSVVSFCIFHTVHRVLKARILKWFTIPFCSGPRFVRTLHHDPSILGGPVHSMAYSIIELDKAVVHVISLVSFL